MPVGAYATFEAGWVYANTYPTIPDSFVQVVGTKGHISMDRAEESMVMTTEEKFTYPKTFLVSDVFGKLGGAFPTCLASSGSQPTSSTPATSSCAGEMPWRRSDRRRSRSASRAWAWRSPAT